MGQAVKNRSRICPLPSGPFIERPNHMKSRTIMAVSLVFMLTTTGLVYYSMLPPSPPPPLPPLPTPLQLTPHGTITIDGDANFTATALLEGWPGDGSPENPYIIESLDIDLEGAGGHCISISNTRVNFSIRNCNLTGASWFGPERFSGAGIDLTNTTNGRLINNTCTNNIYGIQLYGSDSSTVVYNICTNNTFEGIWTYGSKDCTIANNTCNNNSIGIIIADQAFCTVANNTCNNNGGGIQLYVEPRSNIVIGNTCNNNEHDGISCFDYVNARNKSTESDYNTVISNTCNNNSNGMYLYYSIYYTITNNTCNRNDIGIFLEHSHSNTMTNNICNYNRIGIRLDDSFPNVVVNNTFLGNTEHDIVGEYVSEEEGTDGSDSAVLLLIGPFVGIIMLGAGWKLLPGIRKYN